MNKEIELNSYGRLAFQNNSMPYLFAHRAFRWVDRIIFIDESNSRTVIHTQSYSSFNDASWTAITKEQDDLVVSTYDELNYIETKSFECYENHPVQARMFGCKTQCKECKEEESNKI